MQQPPSDREFRAEATAPPAAVPSSSSASGATTTTMTAAAAAAALSNTLGLNAATGVALPSASTIEEAIRANYNDSSNFGKKHLTLEQKQYIIDAHERNESTRAIAMQMGVGKSSVAAVIQRWKLEKTMERQAGQGRKRKTSEKDEKYFIAKVTIDPCITVKKILLDNACPMLSETTLRCRIKEARRHIKDGVPFRPIKTSAKQPGDRSTPVATGSSSSSSSDSTSPSGTLIISAASEEEGNIVGGMPFEATSSSASVGPAPKKRKAVANVSKAVMI